MATIKALFVAEKIHFETRTEGKLYFTSQFGIIHYVLKQVYFLAKRTFY
jgi:hypothetical protein